MIYDLIREFGKWLKELLLWLPNKLWDLMLDGLASFVEWIPVPEFIQNLGNLFGSIPSGVAYFLGPMNLGPGVTMLMTAYAMRFVIRRLPVIG